MPKKDQKQYLRTKETETTKKQRIEKAVFELAQVDDEYAEYLARVPEDKKKRIDNMVGRTRNALHTIAPLVCVGPAKCPFIQHCPIPERGKAGNLIYGPDSQYPMYQSCVYERFYMQQKVIDYVQHLEVDPQNPVEMAMVNDLAVIDLYKNRAMLVLAAGDRDNEGRDFLRVDTKETQGDHGIMVEQKTQLHPAADYIEKLEKRRDRLLNSLMETRKNKADLRLRGATDEGDTPLVLEIKKLRDAFKKLTDKPEIDDDDPLFID